MMQPRQALKAVFEYVEILMDQYMLIFKYWYIDIGK